MDRLRNLSEALRREDVRVIEGHRLKVHDNRTGKEYEIGVKESKDCYFINSKDLEAIKDGKNQPTRVYDPGYMNTICNTSRICYIDGEKGVLEYRGYPIEQLAEHSSFLEVAFLLINGELPSKGQLDYFSDRVMSHTMLHTDVSAQMKAFRYDAHPMGMLISTVSAFSTLKPDANPALAGEGIYKNIEQRNKQIYRLLGVVPTIAANSYRHRIGREYNVPSESLGYVENFLYMLDHLNEKNYKPHPKLARALDVLFILHAEHEMNCSTSFVRHITSSGVDVYTAIAMAAGALYGPRHGGANEAVIRMLEAIGSKENIPKFIQEVKDKKRVLSGFGHRVYKNYDPRAKIVKKVLFLMTQLAFEVFDICGKEPLIEIAIELEKIALSDEYLYLCPETVSPASCTPTWTSTAD